MMNEITTWCLTERANLGISQESLARAAGITIAQLRLLEGGGAPTLTVLRALAEVLPTTEDQNRRWCGRMAMSPNRLIPVEVVQEPVAVEAPVKPKRSHKKKVVVA